MGSLRSRGARYWAITTEQPYAPCTWLLTTASSAVNLGLAFFETLDFPSVPTGRRGYRTGKLKYVSGYVSSTRVKCPYS